MKSGFMSSIQRSSCNHIIQLCNSSDFSLVCFWMEVYFTIFSQADSHIKLFKSTYISETKFGSINRVLMVEKKLFWIVSWFEQLDTFISMRGFYSNLSLWKLQNIYCVYLFVHKYGYRHSCSMLNWYLFL
jgi:hypothetical protein